MRETDRNLKNVMDDELERRKKGGLFSSIGGGLGGIIGGLGATALGTALAPITGGMSLLASSALTGAGALAGSLAGSRVGADVGGGRRSDAVNLGMNTDVVTGNKKEFGSDVKDRYRRDINNFQDTLNNRILSSAINTGIKSAAFAYAGGLSKPTMPEGTIIDASGNAVEIPQADIAGAQAFQDAGYSNALINPARSLQAPMQGPQPLFGPPVPNIAPVANVAPNPMSGLSPLSNEYLDANNLLNVVNESSNPFFPSSINNLGTPQRFAGVSGQPYQPFN